MGRCGASAEELLRDLNDLQDGTRVVIMCHDARVLLFRYICEHLNEQQVLEIGANDPVRNVSLTQLARAANGSWHLLRYNDVAHLKQAGAPITEHRGEVDARAT